MKIFLAYAAEDHPLAEEIQLALTGSGHQVFFDKTSLPAGGDYHARIERAVRDAAIFVFLISDKSIAQGSYALTELRHAREKWPHPREHLVPVLAHPVPIASLPAYLRSVTILEPEGNVAAEVLAAVEALARLAQPPPMPMPAPVVPAPHPAHPPSEPARPASSHRTQVTLAVISLIGVLGAALIANWPASVPKTGPADPTSTTTPVTTTSANPVPANIEGKRPNDPTAPSSRLRDDTAVAPADAVAGGVPARQPSPSQREPTDADVARSSAEAILQNLQSHEYEALWDRQTSDLAKRLMNREAFIAKMVADRGQLVATATPELISQGYTTVDPMTGYRGHIYSFDFLDRYSQGNLYERVVVVKDADGQFRFSGFWVVPAPAVAATGD